MIEIGFSILSSDFAELGSVMGKYENLVDFIHMDIMDGNFVPNLTFGVPVIDSLRKKTKILFEAHLMVTNPLRQWEWYAKSCERILFHIEAENPKRILKKMKGVEKGIVLNPETDVKKIIPFLEEIDVALLMSVAPGFAGQKFKGEVLKKIFRLRNIIDRKNLKCKISVDGGINHTTAKLCSEAGVHQIIASSWLTTGDVAKKINFLKSLS
ncbi:MAG: ribulose-phosphate 3-epimerase [Elusimicrobia bacterium]|nr:ribulose-phosphate 3-epimerase [Elusimicrobiota bacterium]